MRCANPPDGNSGRNVTRPSVVQRFQIISSSRLQILELAAIVIGPPLLILISSQSLRFFGLLLLASYCLWRLIEGGAKQTYLR
ncbi:MAG: hypothetical protein CMB79_06035 [Filomicrobium sp.]|nr:hypothetical protein [Filomicrobium sp.]